MIPLRVTVRNKKTTDSSRISRRVAVTVVEFILLGEGIILSTSLIAVTCAMRNHGARRVRNGKEGEVLCEGVVLCFYI